MNEAFIYYLWKFQLLETNIDTISNEMIQILNTGTKNEDSGPDFSNALIKIGNTTWAGNVEIHVRSSDWFKHKHHKDPNFNNIILHVVYEHDLPIYRNNNEQIPTLEIKDKFRYGQYYRYLNFLKSAQWIACQNIIEEVDRFKIFNFMHRLITDRLEEKSKDIIHTLEANKQDWEQTFFIHLCRSFGFKTNSDTFECLAKSFPVKYLNKHKNELLAIEAILFGQAGMLNQKLNDEYPQNLQREYSFYQKKFGLKPVNGHLWKFLRMRPGNFPTIRVAQLAKLIYCKEDLFSTILSLDTYADLVQFFSIRASDYWDTHYQFDKPSLTKVKQLGRTATELILINTIIPFLFIYGKCNNKEKFMSRALHILDQLNGEQNHITRKWENIGIPIKSAFSSQALIHLKHNYCEKKRCLECNIGIELLKKA